MTDHFTKLFAGKVTISMDGVPMLFVHVETRFYFRMLFAEFYCPFRIALYIEMGTIGNADEQEYLFADFKNQCILAKGQALRYARLCEAIIAYFFNIQVVRSALLAY